MYQISEEHGHVAVLMGIQNPVKVPESASALTTLLAHHI
jgi:hypothetical protein